MVDMELEKAIRTVSQIDEGWSIAGTSVLPAALYADLLPVPFRAHGRDKSGIDCVGLFLELQRRLGRELPQYASEEGVLAIARMEWERVSVAQCGDAVLIRSADPLWHIATALGAGKMIHARSGAGVVVESFDGPAYQRRIEGFYRWRSACAPFA